MHFGEYELSPSLISLSPLPSVHWNTFQRIPIRTSSWCYPTFILTKGRSLGFASTHSDYHALLRLAFASAPGLKPLTLPEKVTRRFIMQKARRHTFPSQYWFAIGLSGVFSLTGWAPLIHTEFLVLRATQDSTRLR